MKAALYSKFQGPVTIETLPDPAPVAGEVVLKVEATGLCRSDWHGWMGHDSDIELPHVPGHELAGTVVELGKDITRFKVGDRVTVPFVGGCGKCPECASGNHQVCDNQFQPGFTHWGSFAEYVGIHYADINLVRLPQEVTFETAASLGCRFITSYRAVVYQGQVKPDQWVAIHGCGGVGLSAIMIAKAKGAKVIAVDINEEVLKMAQSIGADHCVNAIEIDPVGAIKELSAGGAHVSLDALGNKTTCYNSIASLRKRGKHIQVGLMAGDDYDPKIPMHLVVANELEVIGSHGMQAHVYPEMLDMIKTGDLTPDKLIGDLISLERGAELLPRMNEFKSNGVTVINQF
ncbi:zinc-dependent alcohol dehydrogenase family protein [Roseivirga sp. E12]|uniref:zinc-dependent alcohol dehydrogenase family protein n=1 Tax=Roseivirga sp. E12 TaxID=2819237 RepID=UPI001ABC29FF|nr:zinc-dependent alcohol dehydrogenase family protein [Roseivirga sp. E12]MBO3698579.1 zinc-dependent alcohol dehydrogenase family protein [Roseivirga sp. E12]